MNICVCIFACERDYVYNFACAKLKIFENKSIQKENERRKNQAYKAMLINRSGSRKPSETAIHKKREVRKERENKDEKYNLIPKKS